MNTVYMPLYGVSYLAGVAAKNLPSKKENARILAMIANDTSQSVKDALNGFIAGKGAEWNKKVYDYNFVEWSDYCVSGNWFIFTTSSRGIYF